MFSYIDEAGVDVVAPGLSVPGGQLHAVVVVWMERQTLIYERNSRKLIFTASKNRFLDTN